MTKEEFIYPIENWSNYKTLLWEGLQLTTGLVIEMGVGEGSTKLLHDYCLEAGRELKSYEFNEEWFNKYLHLKSDTHFIAFTPDWDVLYLKCDLLFIDHSPGERRKIDLERAKDIANIIVVHDTEPNADYGYQMRDILKRFKYIKEFESDGAWTTMVSNFIEF